MKKPRIVIALLLCALLLGGCAATELLGSLASGGDDVPRFADMVYERPQRALDDLEDNLTALEKALERGSSIRTVTAILDACYEDYYHFDTMYTLAEIRSSLDMTDAYYAEELAFCEQQYSRLQELMDDMYYLCGTSAMAQRLEESYFWEGFAGEYADAELSIYTEETLALMRRESELLAEYRELTANPVVTLDSGRQVELYDYLLTADEANYNAAIMAYYRQYNEPMSRVYIELVKTRQALAAALGFAGYEEMAYQYSFDRDFSVEQTAQYLKQIRRLLVPLYRELADYTVDHAWLEADELLAILRRGARAMGGEVEEAFAFLYEHDLYDVSLSSVKAGKSFQTYLEDYEAPYLFLSPYGDDSDILGFAHEFGHFLDAYVNYNAGESIDLAEVYSQAMEYLMLDYAGEFLPEDRLAELRRYKWLDTLDTYVQQASFAAFEQAVYAAAPEMLDAAFLNALSLQIAIDYGYYDGYSEEYYALSWIDITHFFEQPFYVVSYPVSNDLALQLWELEASERGAGLSKLLEMLPREYYGMLDSAEAAGLQSPFAPGRIEQVAKDIRANL